MAAPRQKYCTIYIVRHGQTDWNVAGLTQGETDIPLNSEGVKQAKTLGEELRNIKFDGIFSSDLIRARKTAEIVAIEKKLAVETTKLLRERRYGRLEGKPYTMTKKFHDIWAKLSKKERVSYRPYKEYETEEETVARFITFIREVAVSYLNKTVLMVSHGGIMRTFLNHLSDETYFQGAISNSAYIKLESDGVDFFIKELKGIKNHNE